MSDGVPEGIETKKLERVLWGLGPRFGEVGSPVGGYGRQWSALWTCSAPDNLGPPAPFLRYPHMPFHNTTDSWQNNSVVPLTLFTFASPSRNFRSQASQLSFYFVATCHHEAVRPDSEEGGADTEAYLLGNGAETGQLRVHRARADGMVPFVVFGVLGEQGSHGLAG